MRIKNLKCKCGHDDITFVDAGKQRGIYCTHCGRHLKMAKPEDWYSRQIIENVKISEKEKKEALIKM